MKKVLAVLVAVFGLVVVANAQSYTTNWITAYITNSATGSSYAQIPSTSEGTNSLNTLGLDAGIAYACIPIDWLSPYTTEALTTSDTNSSYKAFVWAMGKKFFETYVDMGENTPDAQTVTEGVRSSTGGYIEYSHQIKTEISVTGTTVKPE